MFNYFNLSVQISRSTNVTHIYFAISERIILLYPALVIRAGFFPPLCKEEATTQQHFQKIVSFAIQLLCKNAIQSFCLPSLN